MTRHKDGVCKFAGVIRLSCICAVNHELCASLLKEELQELDSVAAQAIFVHDHNLLDHSAQDAFQKGKKTFAFEVEATADVGEDAVVRIGSLEVCDLALQILFLVGATDASVDELFRFVQGCIVDLDTEMLADAAKDAMVRPTPKRGLRDSVVLLNDAGRQILYTLTTLLLERSS